MVKEEMAMTNMLSKSLSMALGMLKEKVGVAGEIETQSFITELNEATNINDTVEHQLKHFQQAIPTMTKSQKRQLLTLVVYISQFKHMLKPSTNMTTMIPLANAFVQQAKSVEDKKFGYLAMGALVENHGDLAYHCMNTIVKDVSGKDPKVIVMALDVISKIRDLDLLSQMCQCVRQRLKHTNASVRTKCFVVLHSMFKISPKLISDPEDQIRAAVEDSNPEVMAASLPYLEGLLQVEQLVIF